MSMIEELTPQMKVYSANFSNDGVIEWIPYLMYENPRDLRSTIVNTDSYGFRYSTYGRKHYSATHHDGITNARLIVGNSMVYGLGATKDTNTLASRMSYHSTGEAPWINCGSVAYNSTQELIQVILYRHLLPAISEIVIVSGFNNLGLARFSEKQLIDHGVFFSCNQFFDLVRNQEKTIKATLKDFFSRNYKLKAITSETPSMNNKVFVNKNIVNVEKQISDAADLTLRHLAIWKLLARALDVKLTFVLQPLSSWIREKPCTEEELLFAELDRLGRFTESYGDITTTFACKLYSDQLEYGARKLDVNYFNINPILTEEINADQWIFVDRIHFNDAGYDIMSRILSKELDNHCQSEQIGEDL